MRFGPFFIRLSLGSIYPTWTLAMIDGRHGPALLTRIENDGTVTLGRGFVWTIGPICVWLTRDTRTLVVG